MDAALEPSDILYTSVGSLQHEHDGTRTPFAPSLIYSTSVPCPEVTRGTLLVNSGLS